LAIEKHVALSVHRIDGSFVPARSTDAVEAVIDALKRLLNRDQFA
jgi:hypothetical protein